MNTDQFVKPQMGDLVPTEKGSAAFVPAALPEDLPMAVEVWELLSEATMRIGQLAGVVRTRVVRDPGVLVRPLQVREAYLSSVTEGVDVGGDELLLLELDANGQKRATEPHDASREALNLVRTLAHCARSDTHDFSIDLVCKLHHMLMDGVRGASKQPGVLREHQVFIGSDHRFVPPPPERVMDCMRGWAKWASSDSVKIHPVIKSCMLHYQFETVHPFLDGNGRVGRLLLSLMLASWTPLERPWLYISPFIERNRREYVERMFDVSTKGDWDQWLMFCLRAIIHEATDAHDRICALLELWGEWRELVETKGLKVRMLTLLELLLIHPYVEVTAIAEAMDCHYNTAKGDLERLTELGIVQPLQNRTPLTYVSPHARHITIETEWRGQAKKAA